MSSGATASLAPTKRNDIASPTAPAATLKGSYKRKRDSIVKEENKEEEEEEEEEEVEEEVRTPCLRYYNAAANTISGVRRRLNPCS